MPLAHLSYLLSNVLSDIFYVTFFPRFFKRRFLCDPSAVPLFPRASPPRSSVVMWAGPRPRTFSKAPCGAGGVCEMPCFYPQPAYRTDTGDVVFVERGAIRATLTLACGRCIGCRAERARQWTVRVMHEASMWPENCFITLTYNDAKVPQDGSLRYSHYQRFMKYLRKEVYPKKVRFTCAVNTARSWADRTFMRPFSIMLFGMIVGSGGLLLVDKYFVPPPSKVCGQWVTLKSLTCPSSLRRM